MIAFFRDNFQYYTKAWTQYALSMIIALIASGIGVLLIRYDTAFLHNDIVQRILLVCGFAFPLFALKWWIQQHKTLTYSRVLPVFTLLASGALYYYLSYWNIFASDAVVFSTHWFVIVLTLLLAWVTPLVVSIILCSEKWNTLWSLWKILISNLVVAGVSWLILWGGLSASLASIGYLFDVSVHYKWYAYLGVCSLGIIAVAILFSRISSSESSDYDFYPKLFKFFWLYVFFPLAVIYALILLFYGIKILVSGIWPKGLVAWMVIWYTILWWISYLFIYPLRNKHHIVKYATQGYLVSLMVFALLLTGALWIRIDNYGITPMRYLLGMVVLWMLLSGRRGIRKQNKSLVGMIVIFVVLIISSTYTPRSANAIGQIYQTQQIKSLISTSRLWDIQDFASQHYNIDDLSYEQITDIRLLGEELHYFYNYYGEQASNRVIPADRKTIGQTEYWDQMEMIYHDVFGLTGNIDSIIYYPTFDASSTNYFYLWRDPQSQSLEDISQFHSMITIVSDEPIHYVSEDESLTIDSDQFGEITIVNGDKTIVIQLQDFAQEIYTMSIQHPPKTRIDADDFSIIINNASGQKEENNYKLESYEFDLLIK